MFFFCIYQWSQIYLRRLYIFKAFMHRFESNNDSEIQQNPIYWEQFESHESDKYELAILKFEKKIEAYNKIQPFFDELKNERIQRKKNLVIPWPKRINLFKKSIHEKGIQEFLKTSKHNTFQKHDWSSWLFNNSDGTYEIKRIKKWGESKEGWWYAYWEFMNMYKAGELIEWHPIDEFLLPELRFTIFEEKVSCGVKALSYKSWINCNESSYNLIPEAVKPLEPKLLKKWEKKQKRA